MSITMELAPTIDDIVTNLCGMTPAQWAEMNADYELRRTLAQECTDLLEAAYSGQNSEALAKLHNTLNAIYELDFSVPESDQCNCEKQPLLRDIASILEKGLLDYEVGQISPAQVTDYPTDGLDYVHWLKRLIGDHRAANHPLYAVHLRERGTAEEIRFLLAQETSLDPRFDDILAFMQVGTHGPMKMEIANNYYDEMGNGDFAEVHTELFSRALNSLGVDGDYINDHILLESKICGNISAALALSRRHFYKSAGYFGVTEYLAPRRFRDLTTAWRRLGLSADGIKYHDLHIGVDARHASGWYKNVIKPAVDHDPAVGRDIAVGTLVRLNTSERYLDAVQDIYEQRLSVA